MCSPSPCSFSKPTDKDSQDSSKEIVLRRLAVPNSIFEATKPSEVERPDLQLPKGTNANHLWGVRTIHDQKPERQYFEGNCSLLLVCFSG